MTDVYAKDVCIEPENPAPEPTPTPPTPAPTASVSIVCRKYFHVLSAMYRSLIFFQKPTKAPTPAPVNPTPPTGFPDVVINGDCTNCGLCTGDW